MPPYVRWANSTVAPAWSTPLLQRRQQARGRPTGASTCLVGLTGQYRGCHRYWSPDQTPVAQHARLCPRVYSNTAYCVPRRQGYACLHTSRGRPSCGRGRMTHRCHHGRRFRLDHRPNAELWNRWYGSRVGRCCRPMYQASRQPVHARKTVSNVICVRRKGSAVPSYTSNPAELIVGDNEYVR